MQPRSSGLSKANRRYAVAAIKGYTGNDQGVAGDLGYDYGTRLKSPYVFLMNTYQH